MENSQKMYKNVEIKLNCENVTGSWRKQMETFHLTIMYIHKLTEVSVNLLKQIWWTDKNDKKIWNSYQSHLNSNTHC